jgi:uncharacterized protein (DUF486 family)
VDYYIIVMMSENMNYFLFVVLIFCSAIFYSFGNFYSKIPGISQSFWKIFFVSIIFVLIEYSFRIPAVVILGKNMSSVLIYTIIQVITFFCVLLFSKFVLKEEVKPITYGLLVVIMTLIVAHNIIIKKGGH